jgi:hypothetical protein
LAHGIFISQYGTTVPGTFQDPSRTMLEFELQNQAQIAELQDKNYLDQLMLLEG